MWKYWSRGKQVKEDKKSESYKLKKESVKKDGSIHGRPGEPNWSEQKEDKEVVPQRIETALSRKDSERKGWSVTA